MASTPATSISARVKWLFDPVIQSRGQDYFESHLVDILKIYPTSAKLKVRGTRTYTVNISWEQNAKGRPSVHCTCPYFDSGDACKHLWAALLTLDTLPASQLAGFPSGSDIDVELLGHEEGDDFDDDEFDDGDDIDSDDDAEDHVENPEHPSFFSHPILDEIENLSRRASNSRDRQAVEHQQLPPLDLWFVLLVPGTGANPDLKIEFSERRISKQTPEASYRKLKPTKADLERVQEDRARSLLLTLLTLADSGSYRYTQYGEKEYERVPIPPSLRSELLRQLIASGRLLFQEKSEKVPDPTPVLTLDPEPWTLELSFTEVNGGTQVIGHLTRSGESRTVQDPLSILPSGEIFFRDSIGTLAPSTPFGWILALRANNPELVIPPEKLESFAERLRFSIDCPKVNWPAHLAWEVVRITPKALIFVQTHDSYRSPPAFELRMFFDYDGTRQYAAIRELELPAIDKKVIYQRDLAFEDQARALLAKVVREHHLIPLGGSGDHLILPRLLPAVLEPLMAAGMQVEVLGKTVSRASSRKIKLEGTGIDWLDLTAEIDFENGQKHGLPQLLEAIRSGNRVIQLGNGSLGILPQEWLKQLESLAVLGHENGSALRLTPAQAILLQGTLKEEARLHADRTYQNLQEQVRDLLSPRTDPVSQGFQGTLRPYQAAGLGWLRSLGKIGAGGILADDMGLGKTIQALAYLQSLHRNRDTGGSPHKPSLVVAPKSLLFNWRREAERFTPELRVLSHEGAARCKESQAFLEYDIVLVTYATLRNDFHLFREVGFEAIFADEAQAIKNPKSVSAIACRAIQARARIAMTGTPVENSLHDLFSLLDFTNPGLLADRARSRYLKASRSDSYNPELLLTLTRAIQPFILRRTKEQVLDELPPKTEQILYCELSPSEMKRYGALRDHYRESLDREIKARGIARSQILIIEALLRLRQAACHPALLTEKKGKKTKNAGPATGSPSSAKLEMLLEHLTELAAEGRKALVFSQFTSFLDIIRNALIDNDITFEYLDGATQDRQERVDRFQKSQESKVFLISLKAGGTGLNLTSADTVFLVDPWWNPAVEAQAIDRAHRIGQSSKVTAYRLIARDTVEEKILVLQERKRNLAALLVQDSVTDGSSAITGEDLDYLFS